MGFRFRKSIKLAPGLRMNLSGSGVSWSVGPRGASMSFGQRGTYFNTGIPGTGLYSRQRIDGGSQTSSSSGRQLTQIALTVRIDDDGIVSFLDANGNPAPDSWITAAKKQQGDVIKNLIQGECDKINGQIEALGEIHQYTPDPKVRPTYNPIQFDRPRPSRPILRKPGFFASLFKSSKERIARENEELQRAYQEATKAWEQNKAEFDLSETLRKKFIERDIYSDPTAMMTYLEGNLQDISWPKETQVSFDIFDNGKRVFLDVDLPEIEDLPTRTASVPSRGYKLSVKELGATQVQKLYMKHVHAVGFRIAGEVFASLPTTDEVVLSAYSQRPDPATGQIRDDYLYSVRAKRPDWENIRFNNLQGLDVIEAFNQFELVRDMSKTGVFKPIRPMEP